MSSIPASLNSTRPPIPPDERRLRQVSVELEANFLAEMLKQTGLGEARESFGGGVGEDGFASFLRQSHANQMARAGGIGLAQHIYESLKARENG